MILVICAFIPTFHNFRKITGLEHESGWEFAYYIIFPWLFNMGWASLQISPYELSTIADVLPQTQSTSVGI